MEAKLLAVSGLQDDPQFRRLLKFQTRRRAGLHGSDFEIRAETIRVYMRSDDPRLWFTVYRLRVRSPEDVRRQAGRARDREPDAGGRWLLEKRYSEFYEFRRRHLKRVEAWEDAVRHEYAQQKQTATKGSGDTRREVFALLSNALRRAISPSFPKKHMHVDTDAIVAQRVSGLTRFVKQLLGVCADMSVFMMHRQLQSSAYATSWSLLCGIRQELETFLEIPKVQKASEARRQAAVLALQDVEMTSEFSKKAEALLCCICLNESEESPEMEQTDAPVRLPCGHCFHEDCVMDWFSASTTCPLCRRSSISDSTAD